ncbi:MAG: hypothetical protein PHW03_05290 [Eubacteriales bacterium]|nr:hypothetical protein [Eubacteriales bacterium]
MAKKYYNNPVCVGGTIVADFAVKARELRDIAERVQALFVATTNDMNNMDYITNTGGETPTIGVNWPFYNVAAGADSGANFHSAVMAVANHVLAITEAELADIDMG